MTDNVHEQVLDATSGDGEVQPTEIASGQAQAAEAGAPEAPAAEGEEIDLGTEIERLKAEAAANLDGWQRALAEFTNYRRLNEAERSQLVFLTGVKIMEKMLPVIDDFDRALANLPEGLQSNGWVEGVRLTRNKLIGILESEGLSIIPVAPGDPFDPAVHEAVTHEASDDFAEGRIIAEVQKGYRIGDRVLRPSLVRVAR
ncbi:MAG TPA: nucleotide exchange factor GrpE [Anaerolineae bacterium]|nr:nucleotide exchange factor GrpE [Anaerolineae bacterium]